MHGHTCSEPVGVIAKFTAGLAPVFSFTSYLTPSVCAAPSAVSQLTHTAPSPATVAALPVGFISDSSFAFPGHKQLCSIHLPASALMLSTDAWGFLYRWRCFSILYLCGRNPVGWQPYETPWEEKV